MLEPNALKVTVLFPMYANDETLYPFELWEWWSNSILDIGAHHEFFTRERERNGEPDYQRGATMILWRDEQLTELETFVREAQELFGRVIYLEATKVYVNAIPQS
jgi:hypothetical protein